MIPRELVKKLRRIEIFTSRLANDHLAGGYHSMFRGRGMSFAEVRQYQPGDDVRFIDWNVSARMNDAYVKVFTEEREMNVMLMVDLSASQRFGTRHGYKIDTIAEIAALLAFSAIKNNDQVGLILFTDRVEKYIPPKQGKSHVMRVIAEILRAEPKGTGTDVNIALETLGKVCKRRAVSFLMSDFLTGDFEPVLRTACRKHDIIAIDVSDPAEEHLPAMGLALIEDLESGEVFEVDTSDPTVRHLYDRNTAKQRFARDQLWQRLRIDHVSVSPGDDYVKPLSQLFRRRQRSASS